MRVSELEAVLCSSVVFHFSQNTASSTVNVNGGEAVVCFESLIMCN